MKKKFVIAASFAASLLAVGANAQVSGPNRPGPGTSPGTFQQPSDSKPGLSGSTTTTTTSPRLGVIGSDTSPAQGATSVTPPRTGLNTPDATVGATDPLHSSSSTIRRDGSINDSRDWERGVGGPASDDIGQDRGRLTPPPDISPSPRPLSGAGSVSSAVGPVSPATTDSAPRVGSDLNATGVNTPPRTPEQPLDRALSAKIRAQLSTTPAAGQPVIRVSPERCAI